VEANPRNIEIYQTADGREPFTEWMNRWKGSDAHGRILIRLERARKGNFGDCGPVGEGVSELREHYGAGFRIYFGLDGDKIIVLNGGTKKGQQGDIERAKQFWRDYRA
jgi:putative addiction module killer protein